MSGKKSLKKYLKEFIKKPGNIAATDVLQYVNAGGNLDTRHLRTTVLCEACRKGLLTVLEVLLNAGATVDMPDGHGCTPIYIAASHGQEQIVKKLILIGAKLDVKNKYGFTALVSAVQNGNKHCAKRLIEAGAIVNISRPNTQGNEIPLLSYVLVAQGDWTMGEMMLRAGVLPYKLATPLRYILLEDPNVRVELFEMFIHAGFDMYVDGWMDLMEERGEETNISSTQIAIVQLLRREHESPRSLQRQCRIAIRSALSQSSEHIHISKKIERLPLPLGVKSFVNLEYL